MKKSFLTTLIVFFVFLFISFLSLSTILNNVVYADKAINYSKCIEGSKNELDYTDDSVIVVLDSSISHVNKIHEKSFFKNVDIESIIDLTRCVGDFKDEKPSFKQILKINLKNKSIENVLSTIEILKGIEHVVNAEPNYYYDLETTPSDPYYTSGALWGLDAIYAPLAWNMTKGKGSVRIGIIDTGVSNHVDLSDNLVEGRDTFNDNSITTDDTASHGTHVAGIIGAVGNNDLGVVGVDWDVKLVPLQAVDDSNRFYADSVVVGNVGTSVREELEFIREHLGVCENIYVTGLSLGTFLNSLGYELNNYADDALLDMAREIYNMAEARGSHIIFPTMFYAVSADYRTTAGLKSLNDIGANEAALFGIFPEMSTTGTLAVYGYSGFFTVEEYSVMSDEVKAEYENAARAFVTEIENSKYNNVNKLFFGDTLRLCNENKYSFVSEKGRAPSLQNAIFQHLMVGGETINNITEIFRANPRAGERMLMRVECNIGYTDNRMDMDKFSKAISKCLPDIRWALESGCKVILMASNKVDKDDASDWQAKEFNNGRFLSEFSQAVGVEARFVSVDNIYDVLNDNCSVYWISNLYPYEKYYAFPSA